MAKKDLEIFPRTDGISFRYYPIQPDSFPDI